METQIIWQMAFRFMPSPEV